MQYHHPMYNNKLISKLRTTVQVLIIELTHGLETQRKSLYNPQHGHVVIDGKEKGLIHGLYCNLIQTIIIYYEYRPWLTSGVVKQTVSYSF